MAKSAVRKMRHFVYDESAGKLVLKSESALRAVDPSTLTPALRKRLQALVESRREPRNRKSA